MPSFPIVGVYYWPPAKGILDALPLGTRLQARAEPHNPNDPSAIAVWIETRDLFAQYSDRFDAIREALDRQCSGYGFGAGQILGSQEWRLGYIPRELAVELCRRGFCSAAGILTVGRGAKPAIIIGSTEL